MIIACIISFIVGAMMMMFALGIVSLYKDREPRNKVRFFVTNDDGEKYGLELWLGRPIWDKKVKSWNAGNANSFHIASYYAFSRLNLDLKDFTDMKEGEIREVFINLEDK